MLCSYNIKGILKKKKYKQILIHYMRPLARWLQGNDFVLQQDNDPKHTSHFVKNYLQNQQIEVLPWPPLGPDLNPVENLWSELDRQTEPKNCNCKEELFKQVKEQWVKLSPDYLEKLFESMPSRCEKVIKSCGYLIDY